MGTRMSKKLISYDNFPKEEMENILQTSHENNADVHAEILKGFIDETLEFQNNLTKRREEILRRWATYMNSFWDVKNYIIKNKKAHYNSQWDWGSELLDAMDKYIKEQNSK